jgi:hypothetical protein
MGLRKYFGERNRRATRIIKISQIEDHRHGKTRWQG